jgi:uncharacterized coiled-coil DUF342 family protein
MSETPETDAEKWVEVGYNSFVVSASIASKLERERDEAREKAERYRIEANAMMMQRDEAREELRTAVQERHDFHWELQDAIRDRNEAREEINLYREKLDLLPISWDV